MKTKMVHWSEEDFIYLQKNFPRTQLSKKLFVKMETKPKKKKMLYNFYALLHNVKLWQNILVFARQDIYILSEQVPVRLSLIMSCLLIF